MSDLPGRTNSKQRRAILRGIYEENLRLTNDSRSWDGPARLPFWRKRPRLASFAFLLLGVGSLALLVTGQSGEASLARHAAPNQYSVHVTALPLPPIESTAQDQPLEISAPPFEVVAFSTPPPVSEQAQQASAEMIDPAAYAAPLASAQVPLKKLFGLSVRTIVIDAGHGGVDPGTIGRLGTMEKDITLDVALRLKAKLEQNSDFRILLVRDSDITIPLNQRVTYANAYDTDLLVSIHVNYLPDKSINGIETFYFGPHEDARALKLAERENQGSEYTVSDFEDVIRNMRDTIKFQESKVLALAIQNSLLADARGKDRKDRDRGVKTAPFVVLLGAKAPGVLAEISSLSSPDAEKDLRTEAYRDQVATYLAAGITNYLTKQNRGKKQAYGTDRVAERQ